MAKYPFNPQTTAFTNISLDEIMPRVSPNAWKILCLAIRKTAGWADKSTASGRKESDIISFSQFMSGCGIKSDHTVQQAITECLDKGYLLREVEGNSFRYRLNIDYDMENGAENAAKNGAENAPKSSKIGAENAHTNSKLINNKDNAQQNLQDKQEDTSPAKKETNKVRPEEKYKKRTEEAVFASMSNPMIAYAHFPEDLRPVMLLLETRWYLRPPPKPKKGGGSYAMWIEAGNELLDACGEFGVELLNLLREDWEAYNRENNGLAPHTVSSPRSLVNSAAGKAALLRQGIKVSQWAKKGAPQVRQSRLDV